MPTTVTAERIVNWLRSLEREPTALIVVDPQNDFSDDYPQATLPVNGAGAAIDTISHLLEHADEFADYVVVSQDWHLDPGAHFADSDPNYTDTWPAHCVAGTTGAELHPRLIPADFTGFDAVVHKGAYEAAYSAFETNVELLNSDGEVLVGNLHSWLNELGVGRVIVVGVATDHCVVETVIGAAASGLKVIVPLAATAAVNRAGIASTVVRMLDAGDVNVWGMPA